MNRVIMLVFTCLSLIIAILVFLAKKAGTKTAVAVVGVIIVGAVFIAARDHVSSYSSPEQAYMSSRITQNYPDEVIIGEETAFVFGLNDGKLQYVLVEKADNAWKIGSALHNEETAFALADGCFATVFHRAGTIDHYIMVSILSDEEHIVCDNKGSSFRRTVSSNGVENYIANVKEIPDDYTILIDGRSNRLGD